MEDRLARLENLVRSINARLTSIVTGGITGNVGLKNIADAQINPATQDTLDNVLTALTPNPSDTLTWTSGQLTQIQKIVGGVTYTKTLTWSSGNLTAMTAWS